MRDAVLHVFVLCESVEACFTLFALIGVLLRADCRSHDRAAFFSPRAYAEFAVARSSRQVARLRCRSITA